MTTPNADYDTPWKEALEDYLEPFLAFFFPQVHEVVDWTKEYRSLDKELQQITPTGSAGEREADKLFQVWQRNGELAYQEGEGKGLGLGEEKIEHIPSIIGFKPTS